MVVSGCRQRLKTQSLEGVQSALVLSRLEGAPIPVTLTDRLLAGEDGVDVPLPISGDHRSQVRRGNRNGRSCIDSVAAGETRRTRVAVAAPDQKVGPAVVAGASLSSLGVEASFLVERDAADAVAVAVDATAASAMVTSGEQGEDDVADGLSLIHI